MEPFTLTVYPNGVGGGSSFEVSPSSSPQAPASLFLRTMNPSYFNFELENTDGKYTDYRKSTFLKRGMECRFQYGSDIDYYGFLKNPMVSKRDKRKLDLMVATFLDYVNELPCNGFHRTVADAPLYYEDMIFELFKEHGLHYRYFKLCDLDGNIYDPATAAKTEIPKNTILSYFGVTVGSVLKDIATRGGLVYYETDAPDDGRLATLRIGQQRDRYTTTAYKTYEMNVDVERSEVQEQEDDWANIVVVKGTDVMEIDGDSVRKYGPKTFTMAAPSSTNDRVALIDLSQAYLSDNSVPRYSGPIYLSKPDMEIRPNALVVFMDDGDLAYKDGLETKYYVVSIEHTVGDKASTRLVLENRWVSRTRHDIEQMLAQNRDQSGMYGHKMLGDSYAVQLYQPGDGCVTSAVSNVLRVGSDTLNTTNPAAYA